MKRIFFSVLILLMMSCNVHAVDPLDATKPTNKDLMSTVPGYMRENRAKINEIIDNIPDIANWKVATGSYTASSGDKLMVDTAAIPCTITLPASPSVGSYIDLIDAKGTWGSNNVTLERNGKKIAGVSANYTLSRSKDALRLTYYDNNWGWVVGGLTYSLSPNRPVKTDSGGALESGEYATDADMEAGTDTVKFVTPANVKHYGDTIKYLNGLWFIDSEADLIAAEADANTKIMYIVGPFTLTANRSITHKMIYAPDSATTLNGFTYATTAEVEAGAYKIFDYASGGTFTSTANSQPKAYAEWFGADGTGVTDSGPAIERTFSAFGRLDGVSEMTYLIRTTVDTIGNDMIFNGGRAYYKGHSDLSGGSMFKIVGTVSPGIKGVRIRDVVGDMNGALVGFWFQGVHDLMVEGIDLRNVLSPTANAEAFHIENCFGITIRGGNLIGGMASGSKAISMKADSTSDGSFYDVLNNITVEDIEFHNWNYALYKDFNPADSGTGGLGAPASALLLKNCALLGNPSGAPPGWTMWSYGNYLRSGYEWNSVYVENKTEDNLADFYVHEDTLNFQYTIISHSSKNAAAVFDFDSVSVADGAVKAGYVDIDNLRYASGKIKYDSNPPYDPPAGDWYVFKNIDCEVIYKGPTVTSSDDVLGKYDTYGIWKAGDGTGTFRRLYRRIVPKTSCPPTGFVINPSDDNTLYSNTSLGILGALPSLAKVKAGFRVAFQNDTDTSAIGAKPDGTDRILGYTMTNGDILWTMHKGGIFELTAATGGWQVSYHNGALMDSEDYPVTVGYKLYDSVVHNTAGSQTLKSISVPANTWGNASHWKIIASGQVGGTAGAGHNKRLVLNVGGTAIDLYPTANTYTIGGVGWKAEVDLLSTGIPAPTSTQNLSWVAFGSTGSAPIVPGIISTGNVVAVNDTSAAITISLVSTLENGADIWSLNTWRIVQGD